MRDRRENEPTVRIVHNSETHKLSAYSLIFARFAKKIFSLLPFVLVNVYNFSFITTEKAAVHDGLPPDKS